VARKSKKSTGRRYTAAEKREILRDARREGVEEAADKHNTTSQSIYRWLRERKAA
jgi:transposase-like protein